MKELIIKDYYDKYGKIIFEGDPYAYSIPFPFLFPFLYSPSNFNSWFS